VAAYDDLKSLQQDLIRKAQGGSAFIADISATPITVLTEYHAAVVGPPAVAEYIDLTDIGALEYEDLGYLSDDGLGYESETNESNVSSWQSVSPTRVDITSDTDTLTVVCQETKLKTIGLYTGVDFASITAAADTGETKIDKPTRPTSRYFRLLGVAVDGEGDDEIFIARFMPRVKVSGKVGQSMGKGDDPISWGVTFTGFEDSTLGYSTSYIFGGNGWKSRLTAMGIPSA
jgi:hypothetical protein